MILVDKPRVVPPKIVKKYYLVGDSLVVIFN